MRIKDTLLRFIYLCNIPQRLRDHRELIDELNGECAELTKRNIEMAAALYKTQAILAALRNGNETPKVSMREGFKYLCQLPGEFRLKVFRDAIILVSPGTTPQVVTQDGLKPLDVNYAESA